MIGSQSNSCGVHPKRKVNSACFVVGCPDRLLCVDCLRTHDPSHLDQVLSFEEVMAHKDFLEDLDLRRRSLLVAIKDAMDLHQAGSGGLKKQLDQSFDQLIQLLALKKAEVGEEAIRHFASVLNGAEGDPVRQENAAETLQRMQKELMGVDLGTASDQQRLEGAVFLHRNLPTFQQLVGLFTERMRNGTVSTQEVEYFQARWAAAIWDIALKSLLRKETQTPEEVAGGANQDGNAEEERRKRLVLESKVVSLELQARAAKSVKGTFDEAVGELRAQVEHLMADKAALERELAAEKAAKNDPRPADLAFETQFSLMQDVMDNVGAGKQEVSAALANLQTQMTEQTRLLTTLAATTAPAPVCLVEKCGPISAMGEVTIFGCRGQGRGCTGTGAVWGTDVYTTDGNICLAAKHAGVVTDQGGIFKVINAPGQNSYPATTRHGVTSNAWGVWGKSIRIISLFASPSSVQECGEVSTDGDVTVFGCRGLAHGCTSVGEAWGTDVYTTDGNVCKAARHAGVVTENGGLFKVQRVPGQASYPASTRNGVVSLDWDEWDESIRFFPVTETPPAVEQCGVVSTAGDETVFRCCGLTKGCTSTGAVWGTDVYTTDGNICLAAKHAGVITENGGTFRVLNAPGQTSYPASDRNGVTSHAWGNWHSSIRILPLAQSTETSDAPTRCVQIGTDGDLSVYFCLGKSKGCTNSGATWGTDIYTNDSNRCDAARHSGVLSEAGGKFKLQPLLGQPSYSGSTRNGVTSSNWGNWGASFRILPISATAESAQSCGQLSVEGDTTIFRCRGSANGCNNGGAVWGTDVYTNDSNRCRAARHAGVVGDAGGTFKVVTMAGQSSYTGSERNGVTTNNYGSWGGSFKVVSLSGSAETAQSCGQVSVEGDTVVFRCKGSAKGCTSSGAVWGSDVYTNDSNRCRAAKHAGVISENGGTFKVQNQAGQQNYAPSTRNGVTTSAYGPWNGSIRILPA